jgi:hypothetical protein
MWFYQVAGLLLSGSNSLDHVAGAGSVVSLMSLIFNAAPRYSSVSIFSGLCLAPNMSQVEVLMVGVLFHLLLFAFVLVLSLNCVFIRCNLMFQRFKRFLNSCFCSLRQTLFPCVTAATSTFASSTSSSEISMLDGNGGPRPDALTEDCVKPAIETVDEDVDVFGSDQPFSFHFNIGRSIIKLLVTVFVSTMAALVQFTSCLSLPGYPFPPGESENRWYYDGSQQCFGWRFTIASLLLLPVSTFPLLLWYYMRKLIVLADSNTLTPTQRCALQYCTSSFAANAQAAHDPNNSRRCPDRAAFCGRCGHWMVMWLLGPSCT